MTRSFWFVLLSVIVVGNVAVTQTSTPQVIRGTPPFGSFGGGPDIINLGNLNAHLTIPVRARAGRGSSFEYDLLLRHVDLVSVDIERHHLVAARDELGLDRNCGLGDTGHGFSNHGSLHFPLQRVSDRYPLLLHLHRQGRHTSPIPRSDAREQCLWVGKFPEYPRRRWVWLLPASDGCWWNGDLAHRHTSRQPWQHDGQQRKRDHGDRQQRL